MKLAVIICSYDRKNTSSKNILIKMFKMLENQTYQDFKVFIIGDCYTNNDEFENICKSYNNKIYYENSPIHFREGYFNLKINKWSCGGMNSRLIGIKKAIEENFDYYLHLDDDDFWVPNHIENVVKYINNFPKIDFIICKSKYKNYMLPIEHKQINEKKYNNFIIKPCNSVHSSWVINLNTLGTIFIDLFEKRLNIINEIKNKKIKEYELNPFDSEILKELFNLQKTNKIKAICILEKTVVKNTDINIPS